MIAMQTRLVKKPEMPQEDRPAVFSVEYLGCRITVRSERIAGEVPRGSYEIVPASERTQSLFENLGISAISSDAPDAADPQFLCEWAKCEIDFLLEQPF